MAEVGITRREWAAALGATAAASAQQAVPAPAGGDTEVLAQARSEIRQAAAALERFHLPPATEPAFVFRP